MGGGKSPDLLAFGQMYLDETQKPVNHITPLGSCDAAYDYILKHQFYIFLHDSLCFNCFNADCHALLEIADWKFRNTLEIRCQGTH